MLYVSGWRLIGLCFLVYLFACLVASGTLIINGESALPVSVGLTGSVSKNLNDAEVYRVSINGTPKLLTEKILIRSDSLSVQDVLANRYFQAIQLILSDQQIKTLTSISVKIGEENFVFSRQKFLNNWRVIRQSSSGTHLYQSPDFVSVPRSTLPLWRNVINWGLGWHSVLNIFVSRLPLLLLILTFLFLSSRFGEGIISYIQSWIIRKENWPLYVSIGLAVLIALYRMPYDIHPIRAGLDPSWIVGLNWAYSKGLHWGQDLVFTYGPYYWLLCSDLLLTPSMLWISFTVTMVVFTYSTGVFIFYLLRQAQQQKLSIIVCFIAILTLALFEYTLMDIAIVSSVLLLSVNGHPSYFKCILPACLVLAILSLCKFSYFAVSLCVIVFFCGQCLIKRNYVGLLLSSLTFVAALYVFWILSGQPANNLGLFISRAYEIAQGYPEAMATPIWNETQSLLGNIMTNMSLVGIGIGLLLGIVVLFFTALRQNSIWFKLLLTAPILFLAFKEGFIRMDPAHAALFFAQVQIVLIAYLIFYSELKTISKHVRIILAGSFIALLTLTNAHVPAGYTSELSSIFNADARVKALAQSKNYLQKVYALNQNFKKSVGNSSVDIIPYDISLLYGYGLNWSPRLVFQSYSVHSTVLDSINASHFKKSNAPDKLLFSFKSIDNHYPLFDEPILLRSLISRYKVEERFANTYLLLGRNPLRTTLSPPAQLASSGRHSMNTSIAIPIKSGYYTYLYARVELTILGRLLNFLLKIQPLFVDFNLENYTQPQRFRVIRQTADDGLLVSSFAENFQMASDILSGNAKPNVQSIKFVGNTWIYRPEITTFFRFEACP